MTGALPFDQVPEHRAPSMDRPAHTLTGESADAGFEKLNAETTSGPRSGQRLITDA